MPHGSNRRPLPEFLDGRVPRKTWIPLSPGDPDWMERPKVLQPLSPQASLKLVEERLLTADDTTVFVCLDMEHGQKQHASGLICDVPEIGISIIDSLDFKITSRSFANKWKQFYGAPFEWGKSEQKTHEELRNILEQTFKAETYSNDIRDIILIAHSPAQDTLYLNTRFGIDLLNRDKYPAMIGIIETQRIGRYVIEGEANGFGDLRLSHMLQELDIPYTGLHNAGNDSNYTAKALLRLFFLEFENKKDLNFDQMFRLPAMNAIAQERLPKIPGDFEQWIAVRPEVIPKVRYLPRIVITRPDGESESKADNDRARSEIKQKCIEDIFGEDEDDEVLFLFIENGAVGSGHESIES